jgi:hypothetical protein
VSRLAIERIRVSVEPERVALRADELSAEYEAVLHFGPPRGRIAAWVLGPRIVGIGYAPASDGVEHSLRVFDLGSKLPPGLTRAACLGIFFRHAFAPLINSRRFRTHPVVELAGVDRLRATLGVEAELLVRQGLRAAGAGRIDLMPNLR